MLIETGSNKLAQSIIEALADIRRALEKNADLSKSPSSVSFFRRTYLFLFWEYLCELFIREFRKDTCRIFPKGFFVCIGSFFKEINAKQSLEYWKLHNIFMHFFFSESTANSTQVDGTWLYISQLELNYNVATTCFMSRGLDIYFTRIKL